MTAALDKLSIRSGSSFVGNITDNPIHRLSSSLGIDPTFISIARGQSHSYVSEKVPNAPKDPVKAALDNIRQEVLTKALPELREEDADRDGLFGDTARKSNLKATASKPDESTLEDLSAYIQNQLKSGAGGADRKAARQQLLPVPLRYRHPYKARSREELEPKVIMSRVNRKPALYEYTFPDENPSKINNLRREFMGVGSHLPPLPEIKHNKKAEDEDGEDGNKKPSFNGHFQRIFPEDPTWKLGIIDRLSEICLQTIQAYFQDMPYHMAALPKEIQQRFVNDLPPVSETNLYLSADYFHNEDYWQRSCKLRWGPKTFPHSHCSWKLTYIERSFQQMIEHYVPLQSDPNILLNDLLNIGEYVLRLKVNQLLPPVRHTFGDFAALVEAQMTNHVRCTEPYEKTQAEGIIATDVTERRSKVLKEVPLTEELKRMVDPEGKATIDFPAVKNQGGWSEKAKLKFQRLINRELDFNRGVDEMDKMVFNMTRDLDDTPAHPRTMNPFLAADHINLVPVLANMPHLMDLELRYGVKECGMNFSWRLYQFTLNDAKRLAEALVLTSSLRRLSLTNSRIDDAKGAIVCQALLDHPNLAILELQCNNLGKETAAVVAKMIKRSEVLNKVDLSDNHLGDDGAKELAKSLVRGISLRVLNLRCNQIGDVGAEALLLVTKSCITFVEQLNLSANRITGRIVDLLTESMKVNKRLEKYDLSVNKLEGLVEGRKLQEALTHAYHIQEFWLQENQFPTDFEAMIEELLSRNQEARLEQVLLNVERTSSFDIKKVRFPTEEEIRYGSESDLSDEGESSEEEEESNSQKAASYRRQMEEYSSSDNEVSGHYKSTTSRK
ncbi:hypothetical protein RvY_02314-2 [Ramazzottius varieornatus]|uniref:T-complex-associated testis-expressed protein 1 n=1 Tax=Ramazzottius varieornatus TaxID=947166 RepID=A0A1D1UJC6_RAMVA|nr:hypothetical protein RvY_02314-2 [Ramazzottius varieornatus]